jgi:hypothetical protein
LARFILNIKNKYEPDYTEINKRVERLMTLAGTNKDSCYEWCPNGCKFKVTADDYWAVIQ